MAVIFIYLFSNQVDWSIFVVIFCCVCIHCVVPPNLSMELVWTPWTCGSSHLCTKQRLKTEWRFALCCWATGPTPPCSTATAKALWTWHPLPSWKKDFHVSVDFSSTAQCKKCSSILCDLLLHFFVCFLKTLVFYSTSPLSLFLRTNCTICSHGQYQGLLTLLT